MKSSLKKIIPVWCIAIVLFLLHLAENAFGFDSATDLSVPTVFRYLLIGAVAAAVAYAVLSYRSAPSGRPLFSDHFAAPEKAKIVLVLGSFLFIAGGIALGAATVLSRSGIAPLVTAALAFISGCSLLVLTKQMCAEETGSVIPLLPVMFFSAFWLLALYLPAGNDPVLARYWLPILAAAAAATALSLLSGFFRAETSPRAFSIAARAAIMLCMAAAADLDLASAPLFLGCTVILSAFLALQKD